MTASIEWTFNVTAIIEKLLNDSMKLKNNSFLWTTNTTDIRIDWKKRPRMERFTWEDLHKKCWVNFEGVQTPISQYLFQMAKKYLLRLATNIGFSSK